MTVDQAVEQGILNLMERLSSLLKDRAECHCMETCTPSTCPAPIRQMESHGTREILIAVTGVYDFLLDGNGYRLSPGDACFIDHWVPHQQAYDVIPESIYHIWIYLQNEQCYGALLEILPSGEHNASELLKFNPGLAIYMNKRWDQALSLEPASAERQHIFQTLKEISLDEMLYWEKQETSSQCRHQNVVEWVKNYINVKIGKDVSIEKLEKMTGYNRFYLMRRFKAECNMTIHDYIDCIRRGYVLDAMEKHIPQKQIAEQLGFSSATAFCLWKQRDRQRSKQN